ncbi:MAG TPA: 2-oxoglutarate dehydrogenase, E2 component, dihydrolipoamide succinyltransferase [Terriglobales bacterium]
MPTDVIMPQMGESIFEGTITKWLKKPGDKVQRDEPLFEISTDKVDAEIPAPAAGVLREIKVQEGATVQVNTVVGVIDADGAAARTAPASAPAMTAAEPAPSVPPAKSAPPAPSTKSAPAAGDGGGAAPTGPGTNVVMPQMGESIFEGTITKWLKKTGERVQRDEPLFEISTDKVDAEIPSPTSGVLSEIKVKEGETVQVNTVVAVIAGGSGAAPRQAAPSPQPPVRVAEPVAAPAPLARPSAPEPQVSGERLRSSPLVRRIAREQSVDLTQVAGSGMGGRITKDDILNFIQQHGPGAVAPTLPARPAAPPPPMAPSPAEAPPARPAAGAVPPPALRELPGELVPMTPMRKKIAERMIESRRTSAHVHTIFKVDMTRIVKFREKTRKGWEQRNGVKLTFMPFIAKALMHGIRQKPIINASVIGDSIQYHKNINIGIAVALEWGLIVPVVKGAENLSFVGLQRGITDLGERARAKKLVPDEVQGGTVTITNPGIFGPQFGTPIILQPQLAILGMGGIFKEPVVITDDDGNDSIAVRHIIRLVLGYDHRVIDGADADQFMVAVREYLENFNEDIG